MTDPISIQNHIRSLSGGAGGSGLFSIAQPREIRALNLSPIQKESIGRVEGSSGETFGEILAESIRQVNNLEAQADDAINNLIVGEAGNVHQTLIALQKAEISMRMIVEVRSKVISAYQEVMRMQV